MFSKLTKNFKISKTSKGAAVSTCKRDHFKKAFKTGNIVQLYSRISGSTLQCNSSKVLNGLGSKDVDAASTLWTVAVVDEHTIQLHQDDMFLSIVEGESKLVTKDESNEENTKFKFGFHEQFVLLEAANGSGHHVGLLENGDLKSAIATGTENSSHFAIKIIFEQPTEVEEKKEETAEELDDTTVKENGEADEHKDESTEKKEETTEIVVNGVETVTPEKESDDKSLSKEIEKEVSVKVSSIENTETVKDVVKDVVKDEVKVEG